MRGRKTRPRSRPLTCPQTPDGGFQCATAKVSLNYADPHGTQISIAVIAHLATGPGPSLGWLFFSGGGPEPDASTFPSTPQDLPVALQERHCAPSDHQSHLHRQAKAPQPSVPQGQRLRRAGEPSAHI